MDVTMKTPKLFEALTDSGLRPEAARGVEREVQSSIAQGIEHHRQDDHQQVMTKADGLALENNLRSEMIVMKSELRQEISQLEIRLMRYIHDHGWKMLGVQAAFMGVMMTLMLAAFKWMLGK
jgi:ElaB/YqjD/DUF883 family membrane-anchored ribosome-binding protein